MKRLKLFVRSRLKRLTIGILGVGGYAPSNMLGIGRYTSVLPMNVPKP
jgi:hypothetical protein